ncbi:YesL family protein [Auraticoccus monumenti]|uniref:Uncharacterized membrane protein YesL n=1 Tax=Auraticoccus monumenti TaxID=675864 RepID=A0A1G6W7W7_9ACTN|nr:DUF624 domain-containing protein [Auraticoccus monumenti]SDD61783.1 Uncharacterized membrane protein YesL [Auraticoccus monumenti]
MSEKALPHSVVDAPPSTEHWTLRLNAACSVIATMALLNVCWLAFSLLGGVVLGVAPASVAVAHCVRERGLGRSGNTVATFARTWRRELVGANLALLPQLLVLVALGWNYLAFSAAGPSASAPRLATLAGLLLVATVGCWLPACYVHYDLPRRRFLLTALRFTLARPVPSLLQLFVLAAVGYTSYRLPALVPFLSVGARLYLATWLALRFFAENEDRLAGTSDDPAPDDRALGLPTDPLRMR